MAKFKNIEQYRTQKKLKNFFKSFAFILIVAIIIIVLINVLRLFKGVELNEFIGNKIEGESDTFPVIIKDEQLLDVYNLGSNFTVLTKANTINYLSNGKRSDKISHGYTNPVVREATKRLLVYDRGGNDFKVITSSNVVGKKKLENQIIYADISNSGNIVVVTNHKHYASVITVYDSKLNEIYKYSSGDRITLASFSADAKSIIATSIITNAGILSATLLEIDITEDKPAEKIVVNDILPLDVNYSDGGKITIVGSTEVITYDKKTGTSEKYEYHGDLVALSNSTDNETVVVTQNLVTNSSDINVIDAKGTGVKSLSITDNIKDIYSDGSRIILLGRNAAYNFDMTLTKLNEIPLEKPYNKIIYNGDSMYIIGSDCVEKFKIN